MTSIQKMISNFLMLWSMALIPHRIVKNAAGLHAQQKVEIYSYNFTLSLRAPEINLSIASYSFLKNGPIFQRISASISLFDAMCLIRDRYLLNNSRGNSKGAVYQL